MPDVQIHTLGTMEALRECERVQLAVWGYGEREIVPAAQMRAAQHAGALVAGAFIGRQQVGFLYGFPALPHEPGLAGVGMHSHMLAVVPEARGMGVGTRLKWYQRSWCRTRGLPWVSWTFDPLQAGNARLNLEHLGAVVHEYQADFYGVLGGQLSGQFPTDRFVALWWLDHEHVTRRLPDAACGRAAAAHPQPLRKRHRRCWALQRLEDDAPGHLAADVEAPEVWLAAPSDVNALRARDPDRALAWRSAYQELLPAYFARGYEARAFAEGSYLLFDHRLRPPGAAGPVPAEER